MPFSYHPPTRKNCPVCESLEAKSEPIIDTHNGRASSADNFPIHNWYNFVLGYSPQFPDYIIEREKASKDSLIVDPFMGSGTTLICAKSKGIESAGVDANDFFAFAAKTKLNWDIDIEELEKVSEKFLKKLQAEFSKYKWPNKDGNPELFDGGKIPYDEIAKNERPEKIDARYVSDAPFAKLHIIKEAILKTNWSNEKIKNIFLLCFSSIIVPSSNVYYGPGFGVRKPKNDIDVYSLFKDKLIRMVKDLKDSKKQAKVKANTYLGDARQLSKHLKENSVDLMITSPPYPGDHEYTKHSKLELIFLDYAMNLEEFRKIKKRMLRGSTTNVYKADNEGKLIEDLASIKEITDEIDRRIKEDNGTSGFEKLYCKLVWEYFGGMYKVFEEALKVLKPGGKFVLLVSDSHAFKMVHIQTATLLAEVAEKAGFTNSHIELWQYKGSTSHKYRLFEEILTVEKPKKS